MLFQIKALTKVYGDRTVLDLPDLAFEKGIVYALQGPNGSGKTTLLEILSLLIPPTTGEILYDGRTIDFTRNNLTALRREIVMVQQNPVLFTTTVYKNLEFGLKVRGITKGARKKTIEEALDLVGMRPFSDAEAHRLSGGETQRTAIARALVCMPKVLFFDEPTSNVDVENQIAIERIIQDINLQKHISVIFTTHNHTQASRLSSRAISLFEGRTVPSGYENIFVGWITVDDAGNARCRVQDRVTLALRSEKTGRVRLSIDPLKLKMAGPDDPEPGKTVIPGRLLQLTDEHDHVRALVDIGIPLTLLSPKKDLKERPLVIGELVSVSCPPDAVQIF